MKLRSKQGGVVLLAIMLVIVVSASFVLVSKLNANARQFTRQSSSLPALNQAKAALIGYAVTYPENVNPNAGPGYLPCPDLNDDGNAAGACALAGPVNFTLGRFPFETLDVADLRDSNGQRLWYALSDNYRNFAGFTPLNSETPGQLNLDGDGDIVAVLIAPGLALDGQNRAAAPLNPANFLEDDNADIDANYVSNAAGQFNDVLVTITRQELMQAVEKRVLGEVAIAMTNYQTTYNAYPWLVPFADPSTSVYRGQATSVQGHLPFHWAADPNSDEVLGAGLGIAGRNPFSTNVAVRWDDITGATISASNNPLAWLGLANFVSAACLNDINDCDEGGQYPEITSLSPPANIDCTWSDRNTADCGSVSASFTRNITSGACPLSQLTRTYTIDFPQFTGNPTIINPTAADIRRRDVSLTAVNPVFIPAQVNAITVVETMTGQVDVLGFFCIPLINFVVETRTSTFDADTEGSIAVNGIHYDIDIDNTELPTWFVSNDWQELIYLAYASGEPLPGNTAAGQDCFTLATNCLSVDADNIVTPNVRAVVVTAGADLTPGTARPNANLADYFELENSIVDDLFMKDKISNAANDRTRIIATAP